MLGRHVTRALCALCAIALPALAASTAAGALDPAAEAKNFSFIPNQAFGATLRGADLVSWYTTARFDKYVKRDPTADRRLLTDRWRHDGPEAAVDPDGDGNMFSFYHRSRLDITRADGTKVECEDLRSGCGALTADDGYAGDYAYAHIDRSPDR
jgi:hypothetical protein